MIYKVKSIIIGRKKNEGKELLGRPCFISMFDTNDPHIKNISPKKILDFKSIKKVILKGFEVNYLLEGNDILVNNLSSLEIKQNPKNKHLILSGKQD